MSQPVDVAIVGAGWMGRRHADAVIAAGDRVAVVIDPDPERRRALASVLGAAEVADLAAIDDLDVHVGAAVVAGPSSTHLDTAIMLLERDIAVLVEKPHRLPGQDPTVLLDLERHGAMVRIGMSFRFDAAIAAAVTALRDGSLGTLIEVHDWVAFELNPDTLAPWYFDPQVSGGGVLLTNGIHVFDRLRWIVGSDLTIESAALSKVFPSHACEDHASLHGHIGMVPFAVSLLWTPVAVSPPRLTLVGDRGIAVAEAGRRWRVTSDKATSSQGEVGHEDDMLVRQWRAFLDDSPDCPRPSEVEVALHDIEQVYAGRGGDRGRPGQPRTTD